MEPVHEMNGAVSLSPTDTPSTVDDETKDASLEAEDFTPISLPPLSTESSLSHKKDVSKTFEEATGTWCANSKAVASHDGSQEITTDYSSHVVLIRGRASSKNTPLFLVTDGAGSATAYIHQPALSTGHRIYALESPFLHAPQEYTCTVEEVCRKYCAAIRKTQAKGPYIVGGWSAGAVYAYEIARQLLEQGERILDLILIDMRVPRPMPDAFEPTLDLIESAGLFTGINRSGQSQTPASQKLKEHLVNTVKALTMYQPVPMDPFRRPNRSTVIWAKKGLSESEQGDPFGLRRETSSGPQFVEENSMGNIMEDPET
ncbi:MAG: hypothetical protein Q9164_002146, partial [Protoblastenia rupestris]